MPGVRYGPDISDDAAYFVDNVKDIQARIRAGGKISNNDRTMLKNAAELALNVFGVNKRDFNKGKLGEMAEIARYGGSKPLSRRAKDSRDGSIMTKSVAEELLDRSTGKNSRGSRTKPGDDTYYEGRTRSKRFRQLEENAIARLNKKGMKAKGTQKAIIRGSVNPTNFKEKVDTLKITKARGGKKDMARGTASSDLMNRVRGGAGQSTKPGISIRPTLSASQQRSVQRAKKTPKPKKAASSKRAAARQTATAKTVKRGGKKK
jgi:hypothetical protein